MRKLILAVALVIAASAITVYGFVSNPAGDFDYPSLENNGDFQIINNVNPTNIVDANNEFALDFYSQTKNGDENIFFSPLSIFVAFAITYEGAQEDTADEIQKIFLFPTDEQERQREFESILNGFKNSGLWGLSDADYKLHMANALWIADHFEPLQEYVDTAKTRYDSRVDKVDFVTNTGINTINDWVKSETQNKIEKLFEPDSTDELTALIITNAIYFKGDW